MSKSGYSKYTYHDLDGTTHRIRHIKYLPPTPLEPSGWFTWKHKVLLHRLAVARECDPRVNTLWKVARQREIQRCGEDRLYLANVYGTIYESRPDEDGNRNAGYLPLVMYPFQIQLWDWLDERMISKGVYGDGIVPKAREMGVSNITVMWSGTKWMVDSPFSARLASRVAELVDNAGDPDSMFWKLDTFLQGMPSWLLQAFAPGFSWKKHRRSMMLRNPRNGNTIKGESTTANLGRGGRAAVIIYDEAPFMDNFGMIWTAGRASTRHRIAVGTVNISNGMAFHNMHKHKEGYSDIPVLELPWNAHPEHGLEWLQSEFKRDTPEGVKREVLMDYFAGTGEWVYPESQNKTIGDYPYDPYVGPIYGCFDDGFDDEWSIHLIQYNLRSGRHRVLESYRNSHKKVDFYGSLMTGVPRSDFHWGDDEHAFVRVIQSVPGVTWIGDPHISNREQVSGMSVFDRLSQEWNIHVMYDMQNRSHTDRRVALSHLLPFFDFNDTVRVAYALSSLQRNRFRKQKQGTENQTEAKLPIHDETSHATQAFEWYAVNFEQFSHIHGKHIKWIGEDNL